MKVHILHEFKETPWGGGNQFLTALRKYFIELGVYTESLREADAILFNSYPFRHEEYFEQLLKVKLYTPHKLIIHRLDGPISLVRGKGVELDRAIFRFNKLVADGTVYQSNWIKRKSLELGCPDQKYSTIIINAPDPTIFNGKNAKTHLDQKFKIIATSWSGNIRKGFTVYQWLDRNLDFNQYHMTFVGNSPVEFQHIIHKKPMDSFHLAEELGRHDLYISASKNEPCSNALIEAMHCGLPAMAYNGGGNPEIVAQSGELFQEAEEIPGLLEKIRQNYTSYRNHIHLPDIYEVGKDYYEFMTTIFQKTQQKKYLPKKVFQEDIEAFQMFLEHEELVQKRIPPNSTLRKIVRKISTIRNFYIK